MKSTIVGILVTIVLAAAGTASAKGDMAAIGISGAVVLVRRRRLRSGLAPAPGARA